MWCQVQADLERILAEKVYSALLPDAVYRHFLVFAGLPLNGGPIPHNLRGNLTTAVKIRAHIIVAEVAKSGGLDEKTCCAKLIQGSKVPVLYRFWDSTSPKAREGVWWFDGNIISTCKHHAGRSAADRVEWLRQHLAVSIDWSKMNRIDFISLANADEIPAIEGIGQKMPVYSSAAIPQGKVASKDYWDNFRQYFPAGVKQTVLPFIPNAQGMDLNSFLSRA